MFYQSKDLFVTKFFKHQSEPVECLELTEEGKQVFEIEAPEIELPIDAVPSYVDGDEDEAKSRASEFAKSVLRCEPVRAAKRRLCKGMSCELRERVAQGSLVEAKAWKHTHKSQLEEADFDARIRGWRLLPLGTFFLFALGLIVWSLAVTEPSNALSMLGLSGFLEDHSLLAKISFAITPAVLIFTTLLVIPFVFGPWISQLVDKLTLIACLPIGIATLFFLGKSMGDGMDFDPFSPEPISQWVVLCMVGIASAGVAVGGKIGVRHSLKLIYGFRDSRQLVFHSGRAADWTKFVGHAKGMMTQFQEIVQELDREEEAFAARFVGEVVVARDYLNDISIQAVEQARRQAKPLPACFRSPLDRMKAKPPEPSGKGPAETYEPSSNGSHRPK